jgi:phage regulator Rha-like protein
MEKAIPLDPTTAQKGLPCMSITLTTYKGEARADSRMLAEQLGVQHKSTIALVEKHTKHFLRFGLLPFQTEAVKTPGARGTKHHKFALLNEDQAYFLLSLTKNTAKVVELKANLVMAFSEARNRTSVANVQYLPLYHAMHAEVSALAQRAKDCGSNTPEHLFHINANKALNGAMGIASGERHTLTIEQQLILATLQAVYQRHLHNSLANGDDHREASRKAKEAVQSYMATAGGLLLGELAA